MRPVTLARITSILRSEFKNDFDINSRRGKEIFKVLLTMGLATIGEDGVPKVTYDGWRFVKAYDEGRADVINSYLLRLKDYSEIYRLYVSGITSPSKLCMLTGLNQVAVDISLRLINELSALSCHDYDDFKAKLYPKFERLVYKKYKALSKKLRNKYVPLIELKREILKEMYLGENVFRRLLEAFVKRQGDKIILSQAPLIRSTSFQAVTLFNKAYVYIMMMG